MNPELLNSLVRKKKKPGQQMSEWQTFLEICDIYLEKHKIEKPIVVELGTKRDRQKRFWEQLFGAEHIGIDFSTKTKPDIFGDTHDPKTKETLKKKLNGRSINILFIDAGHHYDEVKKDFEIYAPLCSDIVVLHDIETYRNRKDTRARVWKFWDELKEKGQMGKEEYKNFLFLSIYQYRNIRNHMGIGMIIKK